MQSTVSTATIFPWSCGKSARSPADAGSPRLLVSSCILKPPSLLLATPEYQFLHDKEAQHRPPEGCCPVPWLLWLLSMKDDSNRCPFGFSAEGGWKPKKTRHVSAIGGLAVRGTMARHSYIILELYSLNIIVMKMQPVPSPILPLLPLLG